MQEGVARISSRPCADKRALLEGVRGWLIDLDGVIYRGEQVLAGAEAFVELLRAHRIPFRFLTNNSSRTPAQYETPVAKDGHPG